MERIRYGLRVTKNTYRAGIGAGFGYLPAETSQFVANIPTDLGDSVLNPSTASLIAEMLGSHPESKESAILDQRLPWTEETTSMHDFFPTVISFSDAHQEPIHHKYFPLEESLRFQAEVLRESEAIGAPLTITQQYAIALRLGAERPLAASIIAHSATRAIGRNHDQRVSPDFSYSFDQMRQFAKALAPFPDSPKSDPLGDTYHFWGCVAAGILTAGLSKHHPVQALFYKKSFQQGANIMVLVRNKIARHPLNFVHREVDNLGFSVGWEIALNAQAKATQLRPIHTMS